MRQAKMESIHSVEKDVDKVLDLFESYRNTSNNTIDELIKTIEKSRSELLENITPGQIEFTAQQASTIQKTINHIQQSCNKLVNAHRDVHASVGKIGKAIDKNFVADFSCINEIGLLESPKNVNLLNQVIVEHFLRHGMMDIAEEMIKEANINYGDNQKDRFAEINIILESLKRRELTLVLEWTARWKDRLDKQNSCLEFKIHRLALIQLLEQGASKQVEIIQYARKNMQNLGSKYDREIQHLMGSLLYLKTGISNSPYCYLLDPINWDELRDIFIRDACALLGLSNDSPLAITIDAGCVALPALLNIKQMMLKHKVQNVWQSRDELPVEIDLGRKLHFHSTFACPVLRQQSTENNPPMRLVCGHVISKEALDKLTTNNGKLKCPYCPQETVIADAKLIHF